MPDPHAHPLDRPVWNMLQGRQAGIACVTGVVCRIDPAYGPFAAAAAGHEAELAGLLTGPEDEIWMVETAAVDAVPGTRVLTVVPLVQMIADGPHEDFALDADIAVLGESDVADMAALVRATEPGPWRALSHRYGKFYGIRRDGALAAMAGERMRPAPGFGEVSGVCTAAAFQGQGMAARLICAVMAGLRAGGETPFLHSLPHNAHAIRLYEKLGFRARREMVATVLGRA
jgi:ribosomal protein S18 acetylase RimI-like enzyme